MRGFTLLETLVYMALLGFLLTAAVLTTYTLSINSDRTSIRTETHNEGNFVLGKLNWALNSMKTISTPVSGYSQTLTLVREDNTRVDIRLVNGRIEMRDGIAGTYIPLTTDNVKVSSLQFGFLSGTPAGVEASTTIDGVVFMTRRYLPH